MPWWTGGRYNYRKFNIGKVLNESCDCGRQTMSLIVKLLPFPSVTRRTWKIKLFRGSRTGLDERSWVGYLKSATVRSTILCFFFFYLFIFLLFGDSGFMGLWSKCCLFLDKQLLNVKYPSSLCYTLNNWNVSDTLVEE